MSIWFRRKTSNRMHYYSVTIPLLAILALVGVVIALLTPLLQWLRS